MGALVSISQNKDSDEIGSCSETHPDWQFLVEPNATNFVIEQSHIFISE